jgi:hypothetical protein
MHFILLFGKCSFLGISIFSFSFSYKVFVLFKIKETEITPNIHKTGVIKFNNSDERINEELNENDFRGIVESQVNKNAQTYALNSNLNEIFSLKGFIL